jgi:hypothetical protein
MAELIRFDHRDAANRLWPNVAQLMESREVRARILSSRGHFLGREGRECAVSKRLSLVGAVFTFFQGLWL